MRNNLLSYSFRVAVIALGIAAWIQAGVAAPVQEERQQPAGAIVVQDMFGGQIFGYGIDENGTEGLLSEALSQPDGTLLIASETFDQNTGRIISVVERKTETQDNFVALGVVGNHVGLRQFQHVQGGYVRLRTYDILNPLQGNRYTGQWLVPLNDRTQLFEDVEGDRGNPNVAVMASSFNCCSRFVFGSNVTANTFGPMITLQDPIFNNGVPPILSFDSVHNQAVLAQAEGAPYSHPQDSFGQPEHAEGYRVWRAWIWVGERSSG